MRRQEVRISLSLHCPSLLSVERETFAGLTKSTEPARGEAETLCTSPSVVIRALALPSARSSEAELIARMAGPEHG